MKTFGSRFGWVLGVSALMVGCDDGGTTGDVSDTTSDTDTADTVDTSDTSDTVDTSDTSDTVDTSDTSDTVDTSDTSDTSDTDTEDTTDTADTTGDTDVVEPPPAILINEVASSIDPSDWVELYNAGSSEVDISGWVMRDDDPTHEFVVPADTTLAAGAYLVLDQDIDVFGFGLGSTDSVILSTADGVLVDSVSWLDGDAPDGATWARLPNAGVTWATSWEPTPGAANVPGTEPERTCGDGVINPLTEVCDGELVGDLECTRWGYAGGELGCAAGCAAYDFAGCVARTGLVINEVSSSDDDAIELFNGAATAVAVGGYRLVDDGDNEYVLPATTIAAGAYLVLRKGTDHTFGIGGGDALTLYDATATLIDFVDWSEGEALVSYCRQPNGTGGFVACTTPTFGASNVQ